MLATPKDVTHTHLLPNPTGDQLEGTGGDLLTGGGDADDDALTPSLVAGLEGGPHHVDVAGAVEGVVATAVGHVDEFLLDGLLAQLAGVDEVGGPEAAGPLLLLVVDVDHDDAAGAALHRALHHRQPHATRPEDGHVRPLFHLGRHHRRPVPGRDPTTQQARPVHRRFRVDRYHRDVRHHRVLREGRRAHEVQDVLALALEPCRPVRHHSFPLRGPDLATQIRLARLAELAFAAFWGAVL